jgi:hypothetical protein
MAEYFSDHYQDDDVNTAPGGQQVTVSEGINGAVIRYKKASVLATDMNDGDYYRLFRAKSTDRPLAIYLTSASTGAAGDISIGVMRHGVRANGPIIQAYGHKGLAKQTDVNAADLHLIDIFSPVLGSSATPGTTLRGVPLHAIVQDSQADPSTTNGAVEIYDIVMECDEDFTAGGLMTIEMHYIGD